jgi:hypothetical protein
VLCCPSGKGQAWMSAMPPGRGGVNCGAMRPMLWQAVRPLFGATVTSAAFTSTDVHFRSLS